MKKTALTVVMTILVAACAHAYFPNVLPFMESGAIKTWSSGETLTSADLNANFQHIHNLMVGGHGARLVDSDISSLANISSSKLAAYRALPRAWVYATNCTGASCTVSASYNVTSIARSGAGRYTVTLSYTATNVVFAVVCSENSVAAVSLAFVDAVPASTTTFGMALNDTAGTPVDRNFSCVVYDND